MKDRLPLLCEEIKKSLVIKDEMLDFDFELKIKDRKPRITAVDYRKAIAIVEYHKSTGNLHTEYEVDLAHKIIEIYEFDNSKPDKEVF